MCRAAHAIADARESLSDCRSSVCLTRALAAVLLFLPLPRRRPGVLVQANYKLGALVMYRESQAGGDGHYKTIVRSPDGWRSYDGMVSGGVGVRISSPAGDHLPRAGHWFPVEVVYERVPG